MLRDLLALFATLVLTGLRRTWRIHLHGPEPPTGKPLIFAFLHGDQAGLFGYPHPAPVGVIVSHSRDGDLQAAILRRLGFRVCRGSSRRGGARGLRELVRMLGQGTDIAVAVDGPRGPRGEVKPGVMEAARLAGACVIPLAVQARPVWTARRAWDRYTLPLPFARVDIRRGAPVVVNRQSPANASTDELSAALAALGRGPTDGPFCLASGPSRGLIYRSAQGSSPCYGGHPHGK